MKQKLFETFEKSHLINVFVEDEGITLNVYVDDKDEADEYSISELKLGQQTLVNEYIEAYKTENSIDNNTEFYFSISK